MIARHSLLILALLATADGEASSPAEPKKPAPGVTPSASDQEKDKESAARVLELAKRYEFFLDAARQEPLELHAKPVLTYANPIRGEVYGNVFVWTRDGRPEVLGAVFDFRNEGKFDSELHTLSRPRISGWREGREFWQPPAAGVEFKKLTEGPAPAGSSAARLRQMREIAKDFVVGRDHPEQGKGEMRLLTQPLYRYASAKAKVVDGALFVFAEGTDPEAFLLLEAREGSSTWGFAFARMNIVEFRATYRGQPVWQVEKVSWDTVFDRHEPYAIIREKPRRGLVRKP